MDDCFLSLKRSTCKILKNMPYKEITKINNIPRKILVFIVAKTSNPFDSLTEKICVSVTSVITKISKNSNEKIPRALEIMKNQNVNPAVTASALNLDDEKFILNRINERYQSSL